MEAQRINEEPDERTLLPAVPPAQAQSRTELQLQVEQAVARPRELSRVKARALQLATLDEPTASECFYSLPARSGGDGKKIEGASVRFAEILAHTWGNCRSGARLIREDHDYVVAQGVFHDLETNTSVTHEVRRKVISKQGRRFSADMVTTTANAACSIAFRQAVLKAIPKALWAPIYEQAVQVAVGDNKTLATRRADAMTYVLKQGAEEANVLHALGVHGVEDITLDHLRTLRGLCNAIKEGDTTVEQAFPAPSGDAEQASSSVSQLAAALAKKGAAE